jgi:hypothetical protein
LKGPNQNQHGSERCDGYICAFTSHLNLVHQSFGSRLVSGPVSPGLGFCSSAFAS